MPQHEGVHTKMDSQPAGAPAWGGDTVPMLPNTVTFQEYHGIVMPEERPKPPPLPWGHTKKDWDSDQAHSRVAHKFATSSLPGLTPAPEILPRHGRICTDYYAWDVDGEPWIEENQAQGWYWVHFNTPDGVYVRVRMRDIVAIERPEERAADL